MGRLAEGASHLRRKDFDMREDEKTLIEIYDRPLCCPSGLCGPTIDPVLLDIQEAVLRIQQEFNGRVQVERYLLSQQPARFMQNPTVLDLLKKNGVAILPVSAVNGQVRKTQVYPTLPELRQWATKERSRDEQH